MRWGIISDDTKAKYAAGKQHKSEAKQHEALLKAKAKDMHKLSDKELADLNKRLQAEKQLKKNLSSDSVFKQQAKQALVTLAIGLILNSTIKGLGSDGKTIRNLSIVDLLSILKHSDEDDEGK